MQFIKFSGVAALLVLAGGCASPPGLLVSEVGSFHVGGRAVTLSGLPEQERVPSPGAPPLRINPNGDFEVEQMYVRFTKLRSPKAKHPLLMWHGGGLSGVSFETKPDGRAGWESYFLAAGHDVYVSDAVERGRASWAKYPEIFKSEPFFRTKKEAWEIFRIGAPGSYASEPTARQSLTGSQFPMAAFDQMAKQAVPRWTTNDAVTQAAYDEYVQKVCPCVIILHSQAGNFAFNSALRFPDKVKAIVAVEPSGTPDLEKTDYSRLRKTPILWVWGDYIEQYPFWKAVRSRQNEFKLRVAQAGGVVDELDLPRLGMPGNSHMLMMDQNSDQIAALIQTWLVKQNLTDGLH